jgi:hypothetical protein
MLILSIFGVAAENRTGISRACERPLFDESGRSIPCEFKGLAAGTERPDLHSAKKPTQRAKVE